MEIMRKLIFLLLLTLPSIFSTGQQPAAVDSLKKELDKAVSVERKVELLDVLSRMLMNVDLKESDEYGKQLIAIAEQSRDRTLMIKAYMSNGTRCSYFAGVQDYANTAISHYNKALTIAKQNRRDEDIGAALLKLSAIQLSIPDKDKALDFANQASSIISTLKNDSLRAESHNANGNVYLARNDKTTALRHYLSALRIAEEVKNHSLIRICYLYLSNFYSGIEEYDKAIDYYMLAHKKLDLMTDKNIPYQRAMDMNNIGKLYSAKTSYDIAISYYEKSLAMADSLKFSTMKVPGYLSLLNQYLRMDQPMKALNYFNSPSGIELKKFLAHFGFSGAIDQAYAVIYMELNRLDSAKYYFDRATPFFEKNNNETTKMSYYAQLGTFYKKNGEYNKAIDLYLKVKDIADRTGQIESSGRAAKHLDTFYTLAGNYQLASEYNSIYYLYKDSLEKINKEKELAQVEAADEQYRQEKLVLEQTEKKRRKNNIQYMAITIGIIVLFLVLVLFGMLKVSTKSIRLLGFFAFIMFFEFVFLLFKKNIYSITQGEPWKDLAFMIALAALLVPLHHWLEHRVIKYLTSQNRLTASGRNLMSKVFIRKKPVDEETKV
jgi:tetratricopeptide (TPR) repeat protein